MERWAGDGSLLVVSVTSDRKNGAVAGTQSMSFEGFYRESFGEVFRTLAVVLRDSDLAQEAMDEAMTRAFQRWTTVREYENPQGWVYRVAVNWARSRLKKRKREVVGDPQPQMWVDPTPDPELDRAVARLPLHYREVVVFRFLFDMSQEQVAAALDIPVGTVKSRLHRALEALRREVSEQ